MYPSGTRGYADRARTVLDMTMTRMMALSVCSALAACMDDASHDDLDAIEDLVGADALRICGENTIASVRTPTGNRAVFCVYDGVEVIGEGGSAAPLPRAAGTCALDTYLGLTDDSTPVPLGLLDSCTRRTGVRPEIARSIVDGPVFTAFPDDDPISSSSKNLGWSFCTSDGELRFAANFCNGTCTVDQGDSCGSWCTNIAISTPHTKSISDVLGEQGNEASETLASCGGTTRFRGLRDRGAVDPAYVTLYDVEVPSGFTWWLTMAYAEDTNHNGIPEDAFFQFRGDPYHGASHRFAGTFVDRK